MNARSRTPGSRAIPVMLAAAVSAVLASSSMAFAQDDHLLCYAVKDPLALRGVVDFDSPAYGALAGCRIGKAKVFCVYGTKSVVEAYDRKSPVELLDVPGAEQLDDRVCYKVKCDSPEAMQQVSDQFGSRVVARGKAALLCTPAVRGPVTTTTLPASMCATASDCPGIDTECQARVCSGGSCGVASSASGTPLGSQVPGDCRQNVCDGSGGTTSAVDDGDVPVDGNECTADLCSGGNPSNPALPVSAPCSQNGGSVCDGSGLCVP